MNFADFFITIGLDDQATSKLGTVAQKAGTAFTKVGTTIIKGTAAAATAIGALTTSAVSSYANYEQLVGGVETLFGAGGKSIEAYAESVGKTVSEAQSSYDSLMAAQSEVLKNADAAYTTAGMSANTYMETVTSFSAALVSSLGGDTQKAASYADMAITDIADNANKMGTEMSAVQNAYQGFAKQNYTMLDNLKLGYGGTKSEMERLLSDAEKLSGKEYDLSSYADIVEAIHVVQDEMGIAGTTADEAAHTISGSVSTMKAAWQNWLTGLGDSDAEIGRLTTQLVDSAKTVLTNVMPVVSQVLSTLGEVISNDAPGIIESGLSFILDAAPRLLEIGGQLLSTLVTGIITNLPQMLTAATQLITMLCTGLMESASEIPGAVSGIITSLVNFLVANAPQLLVTGVTLVLSLIQGLIESIPQIVAAVPQLIDGIITAFESASSQILDIGKQIVDDIKQGISAAWDGLVSWFTGIWDKLFGNRTVNVDVNTNDGGAGKAIGIDYVPYNGLPATLHRGEAVLTAVEADRWRRGLNRSGNAESVAVPSVTVVNTGDAQVAELLSQILDSIGSNLKGNLSKGITSREFSRAVRGVN